MTKRSVLGPLIESLSKPEEIDEDGFRTTATKEQDGIAAILLEISEAILPAKLTFRNDREERLVIVASNRRLSEVLDIPEHIRRGQHPVLGSPLEGCAETLNKAGTVLRTFCAGSETVSVRSTLHDVADLGAAKGIGVAALKQQLAETSPPAGHDQTDAIAEFLAAVMNHADHWVMIEKREVVGHSGGGPDGSLVESVTALRATADGPDHGASPRLLLHTNNPGSQQNAVFAYADDWVFGARSVKGATAAFLQTWRQLGL